MITTNNMLCKFCKKSVKDNYRRIGLGVVHDDCFEPMIKLSIEKGREKRKERMDKMKRCKKEKTLKERLWDYFKMYIYLRDSDENGMCECISCGQVVHYSSKNLHAGHFIPKSKGSYFYFNENNVHSQCGKCNCYGSQDTGANYRENLIKKIGLDLVEELEKNKGSAPIVKFDLDFLNKKIAFYKSRNKELLRLKK
jgi:5-methylcytosine-specific restriction endonuclease McrA